MQSVILSSLAGGLEPEFTCTLPTLYRSHTCQFEAIGLEHGVSSK